MLLERVRKVLAEALESGERRLLAIAGKDSLFFASEVVKSYSKLSKRNDLRILYASKLTTEKKVENARLFKRLLPQEIKADVIPFEESEQAMGRTWDMVVMNLSRQLAPNDLGRLVETVRGSGLVLFVLPPLDEWMEKLTHFQRRLVTPPFKEKDVRQIFKKRFLEKIKSHEGCWLIDLDSSKIYGKERKVERKVVASKLEVEEGDEIAKLARTQDQLEVLKAMERLCGKGGKRVLVVVANRGRGKSAALGLGLAKLISSSRRKSGMVIISAPELPCVKVFFEFLVKGLEASGIKFKVYRDRATKLPLAVKSNDFYVKYFTPYEAMREKAWMKIVDEAASIPVPLLHAIVKSVNFSVFSSTIHGYEGAGRGFSLRFLKSLREMKGLEVEEVRMETPIRYPENDPVEAWLYDTLLLDCEPARLSEEERKRIRLRDVRYVRLDPQELFEKREGTLRQLYGIYVLAHYRNRPNDLATLADAPHHFPRALMYKDKVIVSLQLAEEGGLRNRDIRLIFQEGKEFSGHILPNKLTLNYGIASIAKVKGIRIVRIATHPSLWGKGFGSKALRKVIEEAQNRGYEWVGTSFGASEELVRFWMKNGFIPLYLSPHRNPISGEYSVVMGYPLSERVRKVFTFANCEFKRRLVTALHDIYFSLEPSTARYLLLKGFCREKPRLTRSQRMRVKGFARGSFTYEASCDAIYEITKAYFLDSSEEKPNLEKKTEEMLVAKVLQGKSWEWIRSNYKTMTPIDDIREALREVIEYYV